MLVPGPHGDCIESLLSRDRCRSKPEVVVLEAWHAPPPGGDTPLAVSEPRGDSRLANCLAASPLILDEVGVVAWCC